MGHVIPTALIYLLGLIGAGAVGILPVRVMRILRDLRSVRGHPRRLPALVFVAAGLMPAVHWCLEPGRRNEIAVHLLLPGLQGSRAEVSDLPGNRKEDMHPLQQLWIGSGVGAWLRGARHLACTVADGFSASGTDLRCQHPDSAMVLGHCGADRAGRSDLDTGDVSPLAKRHAL